MNKRRLVAVIILTTVTLTAAGAAAYRYLLKADSPGRTGQTQANEANRAPDTIRFIAVGDMLPHDTVNERAKTAEGYDYRRFFTEVEELFQAADIRFCNQEAPSSGPEFGISGYPSFNAPTEFARDLFGLGCNVISLANNHINDKGQAVLTKTVAVWDELNALAVAGANRSAEEQAKVRYFTQHGVKFAFVAYAEYSNNAHHPAHALNILNEELVQKQLREARSQADIVIVSVHWGTENHQDANDFQRRWAKAFADLGADIVIGHGPHSLQPVEKLAKAGGGETVVWYSLGNFLSTQLETAALIGGIAVMEIDVASKRLTKTRFLPTYMHYEWTAEEAAREDLLARHNLKIYPLDKAAEPLSQSLHKTTIQAQTERVRTILNRLTEVPVITSEQY